MDTSNPVVIRPLPLAQIIMSRNLDINSDINSDDNTTEEYYSELSDGDESGLDD